MGFPLYSEYFANFSPTSRSFISNIRPIFKKPFTTNLSAVCYDAKCSEDKTQIDIKLDEDIILTCRQDNEILSHSNLKG